MNRIETAKSARSFLLGTSTLAAIVLTSSGAWAQNCIDPGLRGGLSQTASLAAGTASSVVGSISNVNTAFLTQQGSAFVSAPGNPQPDQQGGGVWVRGVGGVVDIKSSSSTSVLRNPVVNPATDQGMVPCTSTSHETFAGVQLGQDISRLNINGWNVHLGTTAGYLSARATDKDGPGTFKTDYEVPFVGTYGVITRGGFFADAMVRGEYYNIEMNQPALNMWNQRFSARGVSVTANAGYNIPLQNNWFIEPSAGFIWSNTKVDSFSFVGVPGTGISGTVGIDDIKSELGRATLRTGTSFTSGNLALQPFASASVFHEFADDATASTATCPNCVFGFASPTATVRTPISYSINTATTRVGTYGQFSLGLAGQVLNTGWVGFVRGDYRVGSNIEGWTGNAGIRYQFTPELLPAMPKMPVKAPAPVLPVVVATNWTGFYLGAFGGTAFGRSDIGFVTGDGNQNHPAGFLGGGQAGYNYQFPNRFVLGVEGDIGWTNANSSATCGARTGLDANGFPVQFSPFFLNCRTDLNWIATATAKLGYAWGDRTLLYVKAGGAWADVDVSTTCIAGPNNGIDRTCLNPAGAFTRGFNANENRGGWVVGYGAEFALTQNWSAKAEWNYIGFGDHSVTASDGTLMSDRLRINEVKVGVNYRFAPTLARY